MVKLAWVTLGAWVTMDDEEAGESGAASEEDAITTPCAFFLPVVSRIAWMTRSLGVGGDELFRATGAPTAAATTEVLNFMVEMEDWSWWRGAKRTKDTTIHGL